MKRSGNYELQLLKWTPNLKSDRNFVSKRLSNGQKRNWSRVGESPASHRCRSPAVTTEMRRWLRWICGGGRWSDGGACISRVRRGETSGGAYGFVRAPIEAFSVATDFSRREEHDGGLGFTRFITMMVVASSTVWRAVAPATSSEDGDGGKEGENGGVGERSGDGGIGSLHIYGILNSKY
ncbi:hypothetical protein DY000_02059405 [Brassica cretica]|uniref:Uncharacterized protein n=1 Tax=Brassica cretica TaxID=69181 RepID=A0ABQ7AYG1_BRACR|nr:hypothetical protein DY000_02059405 [Brassica cretica]